MTYLHSLRSGLPLASLSDVSRTGGSSTGFFCSCSAVIITFCSTVCVLKHDDANFSSIVRGSLFFLILCPGARVDITLPRFPVLVLASCGRHTTWHRFCLPWILMNTLRSMDGETPEHARVDLTLSMYHQLELKQGLCRDRNFLFFVFYLKNFLSAWDLHTWLSRQSHCRSGFGGRHCRIDIAGCRRLWAVELQWVLRKVLRPVLYLSKQRVRVVANRGSAPQPFHGKSERQ